MVKLTVDYYKKGEMFGGVQEFLDDFRNIYKDFKGISYTNAINAMTGGITPPGQFSFFEVEMSSFISQYLQRYEKIFKPDVIVKNRSITSITLTGLKKILPIILFWSTMSVVLVELSHTTKNSLRPNLF